MQSILPRYNLRGSKWLWPHENVEAMRILRQRAWTEKVPLDKKPRRKTNYRYFDQLQSLRVQRTPDIYFFQNTLWN